MDPILGEYLAGSRFRLGDFIRMMGEDQIASTRVNINCFSQYFHGHRGAFNMPARPSVAEWRFPENITVVRRSELPDREIARIAFVVFVVGDSFFGMRLVAIKCA